MPVNIDEESQMPTYDSIKLIGQKKVPFIILLVVIVVIYIFLFTFLNNMSVDNDKNRIWIIILEIILVLVLVFVVALNLDELKSGFNFSTEIKNLFNSSPPQINIVAEVDEPTKNTNTTQEIKCSNTTDISGEVFHIFDNKYSYDEAKDVCSSLNARLATYDEIETAYNKGANWCSYGWSDDQLALFPTSKEIYNKLKKIPNHKNDCGRPGINGGYIPDTEIKFGINCFGKKPDMDDTEKHFMNNYTFSPAFCDASYDEFSNDDTNESNPLQLLIAPFNKQKWNEF
jgi:hypothetical protein